MAEIVPTPTTEIVPPVATVPVLVEPTVPVANPDDEGMPEKVKGVLAKEREAARTATARATAAELKVKEFEDRDKSETQKLQEERDALVLDRDALQSQTLRREVADEKGIDPKLAKFLTGSTREEFEAAADELAAATKPGKPTFGAIGQGSRGESAGRVYAASELNDHAFFLANKADILLAQKEGRITD